MGQTVHLIEDFDPALEAESGEFVSLTPQASYEMTRRGMAYRILEEFYSEADLRKNEREYFYEQLGWFSDFDTFLKKNIGYCGRYSLSLAKDSYLLIKYFIDSIVIQAAITRSFLGKKGGADILYWRRNDSDPGSLSAFMYAQKGAMFHRLIPSAIETRPQFSFSLRPMSDHPNTSRPEPEQEAKPSAFKRSLKKMLNAWKYEGLGKSSGGVRVHFLHSGSGHLDPVIRDFVRAGASVSIRADGAGMPSRGEGGQDLEEDCRSAASKLETQGRALVDWVDAQCGFTTAPIVRPYLQDFIRRDCFRILSGAKRYETYYREQGTELVVTHTNTDFASKSALIAARIHGARTVCIQHGADVFIDRAWRITDIDSFDAYLSMDGVSQKKFEACAGKGPVGPCRVLQSPHYLKGVRAQARRSDGGTRPRTILYIPSKLLVHQRYFNCMVYPAGWYFEYQKGLIDLFGSLSGYRFVYKHAASRVRYADESALPYLRDKEHPNIRAVSGPVPDFLKDADAVILDRPTTAFYESVVSGRPTLALYPDFIEGMMDPEALKRFAKSLQRFSSFKDAYSKIALFLKELEGGASGYVQELPLADGSAVDELLRENGGAPILQASR